MSLTPTSKNNPCPICENATGKCRQNREDLSYWQCMTYADTKKGEIIGRWKSLGATKNKQWGQFKPDNSQEWTEEKRREWQAENQQRRHANASAEADKKRKSLSAVTRNEQYTKLFTELKAATPELAPTHKEDLIRRGLAFSQIELLGAVSVRQYQEIKENYSDLLPGVNTQDKQIISIGDGYLYPVRDASGLIVGCQIRLMAFNSGLEAPQKSTEKANKYAWLSGGRGKGTLQQFPKGCKASGELPLAVHYPKEITTLAIGLCEGTGVKPFLAAQRLGVPFIGAAGGHHASSQENLKLALREIKAKIWEKYQGKNIGPAKKDPLALSIYPDAGSVINPSVMVQLRATIELLEGLHLPLKVAWWGQVTKAAGDIDEIDLDTTGIEYLSPDEFWKVAEAAKRDWERDEQIRQAQEPLRKLTYKPDIEISSRYIPHDIISQLPKSGLIGLKAPKGSGKSVFIKALIEIAKTQGITILSITPRIALGREQAVKWEITWIDDYGQMQTRAGSTAQQIEKLAAQKKELIEKLNAPQQLQIVTQNENTPEEVRAEIAAIEKQIDNINRAAYNALGLCWDSLWRTKERDMSNALIIIDEAELGFTHMATSRTCNSRRAEILKIFSSKLSECLTNGGRVVLSDADLTNIPIDYIQALLPFKMKPFIVTNTYKGEETKWRVDYRLGSRGSTLAQVIMLLKVGCHLAITTDSQAEAEALERKILQECPELCSFIQDGEITELAKKGTPPVIRIDRKTTECKAGQNFIQHPNEEILRWQPRALIYTPSMGVGVSIDEHIKRGDSPYFDTVVGLFFGVIEPSQCRQQLARVRANVQRICWSVASGMSGEGCQSFFPEEINQHSYKYQQWGLSINDIATANLGEIYDDGELIDEVSRLRDEHFDNTSRTWNNPHIDLFAKLKARNNYGRANLAKLLIEELKEEGHEVFVVGGVGADITAEIKEIKDEIKHEDAERIDKAPNISTEQAKDINKQATATQSERDAAQKALLKERLPGIEITKEFLYKAATKDQGKWLRQHELFWLCHNIEAAKERDLERYFKKLHSFAKGTAFLPDIYMDMPKIDVIRKSGLFDLVDVNDPGKIYQGDSDEAQVFLQRCYKVSKEFKVAFGGREQITKKSHPVRVANSLLSRVGLKLKKVNKAKNDNRYQIDRVTLDDGDRHAVLKALSQSWDMLQQKTDVCDSLPAEKLEEIYGDGFCPEIASNPEPETDTPIGRSAVLFKTKMQIPLLSESQNECDSSDLKSTSNLVIEEVEKARDEDNSSNLVIESDIRRLYKVRQFEGMFGAVATTPSVMWLPNYRLVELPSNLRDYYVFEAPDGSRMPVADEEGFEPMADEPVAPSLGQQVSEAFKDGVEAVTSFLRGLDGELRYRALDGFGELFPDGLKKLTAIAPDCWDICWEPLK